MVRRHSARTRKIAAEAYDYRCCVICGLRQDGVLDVAHLNQDPTDDNPENLTFLCKSHHRMFDMGLYPVEAVKLLRAHWQVTRGEPNQGIYMKDAGKKAARTRRRSVGAKKAWKTRRARTDEV